MSTTCIDNNGKTKLINPRDTILLLITPEGHVEPWTSISKMCKAHGFSTHALYQKISKIVEGVRVRRWDGYVLANVPKNYKGAFKLRVLDREALRELLGDVGL